MTGSIGLISKSGTKRKTRHRPRSKIFVQRSLIFGIIAILLTVTAASCMQPCIVYGNWVQSTIFSLVLSLLASSNTGITNSAVLSSMQTNLSMTVAEASASSIDSAIATIAADTGFDIAPIFSTTAAQAAEFIATAPSGAIPSGVTAVAASAGENLAASASVAAQTGAASAAVGGISISPALAAGGAVAAGVALGFLINNINHAIAEKIASGVVVNYVPVNIEGYNNWIEMSNGTNPVWKTSYGYNSPCQIAAYYNNPNNPQTSQVLLRIYNPTNQLMYGYKYQLRNDSVFESARFNIPAHSSQPCGSYYPSSVFHYWIGPRGPIYNSDTEAYNAVYSAYSNNKSIQISPDVIGTNGNKQASYNPSDNEWYLPDVENVTDPSNDEYFKLIDPTDYMNWVNNANTNTESGDTGQETQGQDFEDFISDYVDDVSNIQTVPNPEPTVAPTVAPSEDQIFDPDAVVEPAIPVQPTPDPKPDNTAEQIQEMEESMATVSLADKFPFCIPFDLFAIISVVDNVGREAPYFDFTLDLGPGGVHHVVIDFSDFDPVAALARALELIVFIIGLVLAARKIIGD